MIFTKEQIDEFKELAKPLIKFLNDNCHPHVSAIITPTNAELLESVMVVTEIAEAVEACRLRQPSFFLVLDENGVNKPEGEAVELADAIIRIADYFGHKGWDLEDVIKAKMAYNETRPHRHGDKKY